MLSNCHGTCVSRLLSRAPSQRAELLSVDLRTLARPQVQPCDRCTGQQSPSQLQVQPS